ncbi:Putative two-component sensor [Pseudomonas chlororaphis subsp. aurantiaca]|uniref:ATP-binding response regulator n=1 Tax=Pseudomonas chlororaphis TaxID=587753 RepID=UPI00087B7AA0|nr:hybrid sensor histidine kinase/response regulator [Pseudomonas chlororaphis]AZD37055.1 Putative two-component sensor [Pseudomonas chlororaphis subsp. aurantiaca]AZD43394.1 Putative two-component sensor [Pseudomonas chlororaphis subsp. aurantiaca]AZD68316.1 Putative two-component sensor [Pseudomonas chlororaphis subsp. aurantiaca]AZD74529.1 Putative two-component sensor [Pseudomonas chlororaphis subsp. aurantiaca]QIT24214.1 response regulator [Pseudomonas chlororaphis subsp. aurantiaca]
MKFEKNTELDQANLRTIVGSCALAYISVLGFLPGQRLDTYLPIVIYIVLFLLLSIVLRQAIVRWPGHYPARRVLGMVYDYTGTSFGLVVGGEAALPLYAVMVWVNLGNGMRFGSRYLAIATVLALVALLAIYRLTPLWQAQPFMVLMLLITSTVIPIYAHILLERTRKASEEAIAANLEKSRFLAQASHDLRQPIHSIGLFTACLREARLGDEERRLVDNIDRSLLNVSQLFRSILDLYTLDNGRVQPSYQALHLGEFLADQLRQNAEAARWAGVELRLRPCSHWVRADPALLATMVQNVLSNCFKYAARRPVLIGVRKRGAGLAIVIYDRGRGIAEEHLPNLFEEFYRVREQRDKDVEGVGLGLSIVKRLGQLMGLEVAIRSRLGHGTAVSLYGLPLAPPQLQAASLDEARQAGLLTGLKVCLVEDDRNVLLATSALLERWGCVVQAELSGKDLVSDCDIIVADYDLGNHATGIECIDSLRRQRGWAVPALILTGHEVEKIQAALHDRNIAILSKPVRPAELRGSLRALRQQSASASVAGVMPEA